MAERLETRLKLKRFLFHNLRSVRRFLGRNKTVYAEERVEEYRGYWEIGARTLGAEFVSLTDSLWEIRLNGRHTRIKLWMVQLGDPVVNRIADDKVLCYQWATRLGVPVPQHLVFRLEELPKAKEFLRVNPGVYVVKPTSGTSSGVGISTHIRTPQQLENAAVTASLFADELLVERMIFGETCRLLWLGGELIHAVRRRGVRVAGDGRSTITQLLAQQGLGHVSFDLTAEMTLKGQGLTRDTVPEAGQEVVVRSLPAGESTRHELRTVYNETITHLISPAMIEEIRPLLAVMECEIAGVDIVTNNPGVSLKESSGALLEVNPGPGIHHHYITPADHGPDAVAVKVLRYLLRAAN
ncbi:MAG: hypothetical protein HY237_13275 [Acidobacteria bacterium]|nr:hypothetical protein [Acidobacteriota bacterium]